MMLDIGRVRWCLDQQTLLWYLPLWCSADPARTTEPTFGPRDRPWTTTAEGEDAVWHVTPPSIRLSNEWHAALLADQTGVVYALERGGTWWRTDVDLARIVDQRASAIQELNQTLAQRPDVFDDGVETVDGQAHRSRELPEAPPGGDEGLENLR